jgi:hypothetical protein
MITYPTNYFPLLFKSLVDHDLYVLCYLSMQAAPQRQCDLRCGLRMSEKAAANVFKRLHQLELIEQVQPYTWTLAALGRRLLAAVIGKSGEACACSGSAALTEENPQSLPLSEEDDPAVGTGPSVDPSQSTPMQTRGMPAEGRHREEGHLQSTPMKTRGMPAEGCHREEGHLQSTPMQTRGMPAEGVFCEEGIPAMGGSHTAGHMVVDPVTALAAVSQNCHDAPRENVRALNDLKVLKYLNTTTTTHPLESCSSSKYPGKNLNTITFPESLDSSSRSIKYSTAPDDFFDDEQPEDDPTQEDDIGIDDSRLPHRTIPPDLLSYLERQLVAPGSKRHQPLPFSGQTFQEVIDVLLPHVPTITALRFPIDDHLDRLDHAHEKPCDHGAYKLLMLAGVRGDRLLHLARLPWCTAGYVRALMAQSLCRTNEEVGLLITRIESHDSPRPIDERSGHLLDCECEGCSEERCGICRYCHCRPCTCE